MGLGDWAGWAAFVVSGVAVWVSWKARGDGRKSAEASVRSARAAEESLALQRQEAAERRAADVEAARPRVALRVARGRGTRYRMLNEGTAPAPNIRCIDPPDLSRGLSEPFTLEQHDGHDFHVVAADGVPVPAALRVTWDGQEEPVRVPMPPV